MDSLPFDVKEHFISSIDSPHDLLSFALTRKEWKSVIVPYHLEYRKLKIRPGRTAVWRHLADRRDLAKNIRSIYLISPREPTGEIYPTTLLDNIDEERLLANDIVNDPQYIPEMLRALRNVSRLQEMTWTDFLGHSMLNDLFEALGPCPALLNLRLGEVSPLMYQLKPDNVSLWRLQLSNLTALALKGSMWTALSDDEHQHFLRMVSSACNLEELTYSYTRSSYLISGCIFPRLRKLHLYLEVGYKLHNPPPLVGGCDSAILSFLGEHPTIEDLRWYPMLDVTNLPRGLLPSLTRIISSHSFATGLLRDPTLMRQRAFKFISQISLGPNTLQLLGMINGSQLEEIHIWRFDGIDDVKRLAVLFPNIKALEIPSLGIPSRNNDYTLDDCIDCLASFPALESVRDCTVWLAIHSRGAMEKSSLTRELTTKCPKLKRLNHFKTKSTLEGLDIVFDRQGGEVAWEEEVVPRDWITYN